jgi:hypothetical protein
MIKLAWLSLALLPSTLGCVLYIPEPSRADTRGRIPEEDTTFITEECTTRDEVILELGEPDFVAHQAGEILVYTWYSWKGNLLWAIAGNGAAVGGVIPMGRKGYLFVGIDRAGLVDKYKFDHTIPTARGEAKAWTAMLEGW